MLLVSNVSFLGKTRGLLVKVPSPKALLFILIAPKALIIGFCPDSGLWGRTACFPQGLAELRLARTWTNNCLRGSALKHGETCCRFFVNTSGVHYKTFFFFFYIFSLQAPMWISSYEKPLSLCWNSHGGLAHHGHFLLSVLTSFSHPVTVFPAKRRFESIEMAQCSSRSTLITAPTVLTAAGFQERGSCVLVQPPWVQLLRWHRGWSADNGTFSRLARKKTIQGRTTSLWFSEIIILTSITGFMHVYAAM